MSGTVLIGQEHEITGSFGHCFLIGNCDIESFF